MSSGRRKPNKSKLGSGSSAAPIKYATAKIGGSRSQISSKPSKATSRQADPSSGNQPARKEHFATDPTSHQLDEWLYDDNVLRQGNQPTYLFNELEDESHFDEELEEVITSGSTQKGGKGQNEMLTNWQYAYGDAYLQRLYMQYSPPSPSCVCACGANESVQFQCRDCIASAVACKHCIVQQHRFQPTHRIRKWDKERWERCTLMGLGAQLILGPHQEPCPRGSSRVLLVGDLTGFHSVEVVFCHCVELGTEKADFQQLLDARLFPCSDERPTSAFTFTALDMFHLASTEAKLSGGKFYSLMSEQTNSTLPDMVVDRYREFMRVARAWIWLQTKKRAGHLKQDSESSVTLRCPACPRLNHNYKGDHVTPVNRFQYATHLSYDGSFQLVQRQRAQDDFDICLTDGRMYCANSEQYRSYLDNLQDDAFLNSKLSGCNNHKAAAGTWVRYEGLAVTGIGAVSCARHAFYMPGGVVDYYKGERYAYTDYALGSVIKLLQDEGCDNLGIFYDIYCHWVQKWWDRCLRLPMQIRKPIHYVGGIPKFHIAGHTDLCYMNYSLNILPGVGRLDAEGCERMWSDANQASGSIASKGTGARHDSLNHLFQHWNWKKTTGIVSLLCRKLPQSAQSSVEQRAQWEELNEIIDVSVRQKWSELPTVPYDEGKKTRSVYVLSETASLSVTQALKALRDLEEQDAQEAEQISAAFSTADWIAEGLTIEEVQERLRRDIKERGTTPTSGQALEIGRRRQQLQDRIKRHCNDACLIYTPEQLARYLQTHEAAEDPDVVGRPELTKLALPSRISGFCSHPGTSNDSRVIEAERSLRRASCLQSLQRVRTTSQQKALLLSNKKKNVRGEVKNTRLQTMVSRLTARVELAAWEYNNSYDALLALGATKDDKARLQRLRKEHLAGLTSMLQADRSTGEGHRQLPWFWTVRSMTVGEFDDSDQEKDEGAVHMYWRQWFRAKARYERWEEELLILRREMASVVLSFHAETLCWQARATCEMASFSSGYQSYCMQQAAMWTSLKENALSRFEPALKDGAESCPTCREVVTRFMK